MVNGRGMADLGIVFLTWRRHLQKKLVPYGMTLKQFHLLRVLDRKPFLLPSGIADLLFCDRPTATVVIANMEKAGFVRKEKDAVNRRNVKIFITDAGRERFRLLEGVLETGDEDPLSCLSDGERENFERTLRKLREYAEGRYA